MILLRSNRVLSKLNIQAVQEPPLHMSGTRPLASLERVPDMCKGGPCRDFTKLISKEV
jgi:hypothetical protein